MPYPVASGVPSLSGSWIPRIYARATLKEFWAQSFLQHIVNTNYEGEIKSKGDVCRVRTLDDVIIRAHEDGQDLDYQLLNPGYIDFPIDKGLYWAVAVPDVTKHQSDLDLLAPHTAKAAHHLKLQVYTDMLADIYTEVDSDNAGNTAGKSGSYVLGQTGTPLAVDEDNILQAILDAGAVLDEQEREDNGRWMLLPTWAIRKIKDSEIKEVYITGDQKSSLRTGNVGMIDRFNIFRTDQLSAVTDTVRCTHCLFGDKWATTFAAQIDKSEDLRLEKMFGDARRSLFVYGYKVIDPLGLGHLYITPQVGD